MDRMNLSGAWFGRYRYPSGLGPTVPFWAAIEETGGAIAGSTSEPNSIGAGAPLLHALLAGIRTGSAVRFTKTYDGAADAAHAVEYDGALDPGGERLSGTWHLGRIAGGFEMVRAHVEDDEVEALEADTLAI